MCVHTDHDGTKTHNATITILPGHIHYSQRAMPLLPFQPSRVELHLLYISTYLASH